VPDTFTVIVYSEVSERAQFWSMNHITFFIRPLGRMTPLGSLAPPTSGLT